MTCKCEADNSRYKLLGFDNHKSRVIVMVVATGKVIKVKLSELISSEVMDNTGGFFIPVDLSYCGCTQRVLWPQACKKGHIFCLCE